MANIEIEKLRREIQAILKDADLTEMSAKKVRQQLEEKLHCDLTNRKKEIDELVMDFVNPKDQDDGDSDEDDDDDDDDEEDEESDPESEEEVKPKKRGAPPKKLPAKKKKSAAASSDGSGSNSNGGGSDEEYSPAKGAKGAAPSKKKTTAKKKKDSDSDSDEDWKSPPKTKSKKAPAAPGAKGKGTGFTRPYTLSPELASLMGSEALPRHEVVKKMWALIKERNLYDPKNKQFAICDTDLQKVIGVKRFRTFGMLKYLRPHFLN